MSPSTIYISPAPAEERLNNATDQSAVTENPSQCPAKEHKTCAVSVTLSMAIAKLLRKGIDWNLPRQIQSPCLGTEDDGDDHNVSLEIAPGFQIKLKTDNSNLSSLCFHIENGQLIGALSAEGKKLVGYFYANPDCLLSDLPAITQDPEFNFAATKKRLFRSFSCHTMGEIYFKLFSSDPFPQENSQLSTLQNSVVSSVATGLTSREMADLNGFSKCYLDSIRQSSKDFYQVNTSHGLIFAHLKATSCLKTKAELGLNLRQKPGKP
jgi:hypothetical protein